MKRFRGLVLVGGLLAAALWMGMPASSQTQTGSLPGTGVIGVVKSADGKPMEGVAVSARAQGKTFTTSVWTNQNGEYYFPPLESGQHKMWAQAVGFDRALGEQAVTSGRKLEQNFTLKPIQNFEMQLSDAEWLESLPDETVADRRMKMVLLNNCSTCHQPAFVLQKRFDAASWEIIINKMGKISGWQDPPVKPGTTTPYASPVMDADGKPMGAEQRLWAHYKNDIIQYLARVRGPNTFPLKLKPFPRPTGDATQLVVTEYDVPNNEGSLSKFDTKTFKSTRFTVGKNGETIAEEVSPIDNEYRSGSDWMLGTRSDEQEGASIHDIALGTDGNIYYDGSGVTPDKRGWIWCCGLLKLDIASQKFQVYPRPQGAPGFHNGKVVDPQGYVWGTQQNGAHRISPETGQWTEFKALTPYGRPYDMTIDREGKVWFAQIAVDKIAVIDSRTGDTSEVVLTPFESPEIRPEDIEIGKASGAWTMNAPLYQKGPRRMSADPDGDYVWVGEYWVGRLAKIDIHTKKVVAEYPIPEGRFGHPYKVVVDKNHMVWFALANEDRFGRFNPFTEKFTMYPLPTRGTNSRFMVVDNSSEIPTLWVPYTSAQKIAKVQFRMNTAR